MCEGRFLTPQDLELHRPGEGVATETLRKYREKMERDHIRKGLMRRDWNISRTASDLGISRPTLHELIKKYKIRQDQ